ncbi:MAG: hypothetical protein QM734_14380 [Cyclobacteriaceae bacterium]
MSAAVNTDSPIAYWYTYAPNTTYCQNATSVSSMTAEMNFSGAALRYQWYSNAANSNTGGTLISGATSISYVPSTATVGSTYYYAIATNACNSIASTPINVQIGGPPYFYFQASGTPQVVCQNGIVTPFTVAVYSPYYPATVQWGYYDGHRKDCWNGHVIYFLENTAIGTTGYFVEAINLCGTTYGTHPGVR